jgi:hypothetical protein
MGLQDETKGNVEIFKARLVVKGLTQRENRL